MGKLARPSTAGVPPDSTVPGAPVFVGKSPRYRSKNKALGIDVDLQGHNALQSTFRFDA